MSQSNDRVPWSFMFLEGLPSLLKASEVGRESVVWAPHAPSSSQHANSGMLSVLFNPAAQGSSSRALQMQHRTRQQEAGDMVLCPAPSHGHMAHCCVRFHLQNTSSKIKFHLFQRAIVEH